MSGWPPIADQRTLRRLAIGDSEFNELAQRLARRIGGQTFSESHYERAISYPWSDSIEGGGYLLRDGLTVPIDRLSAEQLAEATSGRRDPAETIYPLVASGSNRSAAVLAKKLEHLPLEQRELVVVHGELSGHAIGHSPHLAVYGSLPATLLKQAGASADVSLLFVSAEQLHALTWTEFNYLLTRVDGENFVSDALGRGPSSLFAYVSRHGHVVAEDGSPQLLAGAGQSVLLDRAAEHAIDRDSRGRDLVRRTIESYAWAVGEAKPRLRKIAVELDRSAWDLHPGLPSD